MAVKLRLMRMGKKKQPTYRLVAADSHNARDGRFIEILGTYEPRQDPSRILFDNDKIVHWLGNGGAGFQDAETRRICRRSGQGTAQTGRLRRRPVHEIFEGNMLLVRERP